MHQTWKGFVFLLVSCLHFWLSVCLIFFYTPRPAQFNVDVVNLNSEWTKQWNCLTPSLPPPAQAFISLDVFCWRCRGNIISKNADCWQPGVVFFLVLHVKALGKVEKTVFQKNQKKRIEVDRETVSLPANSDQCGSGFCDAHPHSWRTVCPHRLLPRLIVLGASQLAKWEETSVREAH